MACVRQLHQLPDWQTPLLLLLLLLPSQKLPLHAGNLLSGGLHVLGRHESWLVVHHLLLLPLHLLWCRHQGQRLKLRLQRRLHHPAGDTKPAGGCISILVGVFRFWWVCVYSGGCVSILVGVFLFWWVYFCSGGCISAGEGAVSLPHGGNSLCCHRCVQSCLSRKGCQFLDPVQIKKGQPLIRKGVASRLCTAKLAGSSYCGAEAC